jgi:DNA-binding transcriptional MerR regulator
MLLFTKSEVCEICDIPPTTLQRWIEAGAVTPTRKGRVGTGRGALFDAQQTFRLTIIGGLAASMSCRPAMVRSLMEMPGEQDAERFERWLLNDLNAWDEETAAANRKQLVAEVIRFPGNEALLEAVDRRFQTLVERAHAKARCARLGRRGVAAR